MQTVGFASQTGHYRLRYINAVLRHPYARHISPLAQELQKELNDKKIYYPATAQLSRDEELSLLFSPLTDTKTFTADLLHWLLSLIKHIATHITDPTAITQESLFRMYTLLNRVSGLIDSGYLTVDIITLHRLITQIVSTTTIPFHGEPAEGIQIMGVLETRNLDFDHIILLSCNEGNMPRGVNDTSFIPYSIRKAYGLTTIDHKVTIYAYYFHRLLQRASDITLVYGHATADGQTGEMSRFMLQMMVESGQSIRKLTLQAGQQPEQRQPQAIQKTEAVMGILTQINTLAPTAINTYMRCPLRFFYRYVSGLSEPDETDENAIDNRIFGNIFHQAAHLRETDAGESDDHLG